MIVRSVNYTWPVLFRWEEGTTVANATLYADALTPQHKPGTGAFRFFEQRIKFFMGLLVYQALKSYGFWWAMPETIDQYAARNYSFGKCLADCACHFVGWAENKEYAYH